MKIAKGICCVIVYLLLVAPGSYGQIHVLKETNVVELRNLASIFHARDQQRKALAEQWAIEQRLPIRTVLPDGTVMEIMDVVDGQPLYYRTFNLNAARTVSTDDVWPGGEAGLDLTGANILIGEWDEASVLTTHQEFGNRVAQQDNPADMSNHSTHVAGTIMAAGTDADARGMAYQADLHTYDWVQDEQEMANEAAGGLLLSNHSYGPVRGWDQVWIDLDGDGQQDPGEVFPAWFGDPSVDATEDYLFGFYSQQAADWDQIVLNAPFYLIVVAAGNDRNDNPPPPGTQYWLVGHGWSTDPRDPDGDNDCIGGSAVSKNVLTIGAVGDIVNGYSEPADVVMSDFSSWGPVDDARIKPDLVGNGVDLYSTVSTNNSAYGTMSGTSMAAPSVTGSLALLQQNYRGTHDAGSLRAATLKALVIHTADEAGNSDGPDYQFGWGLLNTRTAADLITEDGTRGNAISSVVLNEGNTYTLTVFSDGTEPLKATIAWTDPPGTPPPAQLDPMDPMLVNDLDLRITRMEDGHEYLPWHLDVNDPGAAATQQDNSVDNVEQVLVAQPVSGVYTVTVSHKGTLQGGSQRFGMIITGIQIGVRCMDFEDGPDAAPIRSTIPGMTFTTTQGFDWIYGDKTTGKYNVYPYGSGAYVCNGNVFAWLGPNQGMGRIDFTGETAKSVSMWTSCAYTMWLEAYDKDNNLLASDHVPENLWTHTLSQLSVTASNIKYVLVHDQGNYWLIDDLCVDDLLGEAEAFLPEGAEPAMEILEVIAQGALVSHFFNNPGLGILYVILHWPGSEMSLTIYAPDGSLYGEWQTDSPPILVTIPYAQPGEWQFDITAVDVPEDDYPYAFVIGAEAAPPDSTPPVVAIYSPIDGKSYFNTSPVNFSFSAEDQQSGISEISALLDGLVPVENGQDTLLTDLGSHSLQVIAVNGVGLADSAWATFAINGFRWLKPITYLDSLETEIMEVRRNSTLPIKFTVFDSSGAFVPDTTVRVIVEGTQVDFRYGRCDTCVRIDDKDPDEPKYIANLHTNFKHWDYGIYIGTEYWIKTFLNEVLAHKARVIVVEPPGHASKAANVSETFFLSQNHPNPFNPACEITYALPTGSHVTLNVYNLLGQKVRVLVDEYQNAGQRSVTWDGRDEQGQQVTSGIYIYRMQAGDFAQSKRMVLLK